MKMLSIFKINVIIEWTVQIIVNIIVMTEIATLELVYMPFSVII